VSLAFLVPALIGTISFTAAILAWQALGHSDRASGADLQFLFERDRQENARARAEIDFGLYVSAYGAASTELAIADRLDAEAAAHGADDPRAASLRVQAADFRRAGLTRAHFLGYPLGDDGRLVFDEEDVRGSLVRRYEGQVTPTPQGFARVSSDERASSERLAEHVTGLAGAGVVATAAHVSRTRRRKAMLTAVAAAGWVGILVFAIAGIG
jgi:hypothetical protein